MISNCRIPTFIPTGHIASAGAYNLTVFTDFFEGLPHTQRLLCWALGGQGADSVCTLTCCYSAALRVVGDTVLVVCTPFISLSITNESCQFALI
ncbi:hypothetical protein UP10_02055 [Bradyrhizobium sp. LTSPM299]|nr:hypothetical protein UP10_02055 [Bradyrhizobium sp. LTSPM299]